METGEPAGRRNNGHTLLAADRGGLKVSVEKITQVSQAKQLFGELSSGPEDVKLYGQYTYGIAGERFFREIKDNGRLMGTKCQKCQLIY